MGRDDSDGRPSPDDLLDHYGLRDAPPATRDQAASRPQVAAGGRGRLRIYLGMAAGVGKTYAMLNEGRRRKERWTDVVVGYVETHGRPRTAEQLGDLEVIPRQQVTYRGVTLEEMDLAALLARSPAVALVDELAHTNVPGARNAKRYQDVQELLAAGIHVIATLNVQHLDGLNDMVAAITGVRQRETVPDSVLDAADEVELVDIAPDALRARLRHGNVYPPERAARALDHYFTLSNLTALRELALRRVAEKTEGQLESLMRGPGGVLAIPVERVLVAFNARPTAQQVIRDAWRLARGLKASLLAVTVVPPQGGGAQESKRALADALGNALRLAEDLGAEVLIVEGPDIAEALAQVARERHVTQIVLGQPQRSRWADLLRGSVVTRLLRVSTGATIHVVADRASDAQMQRPQDSK